MGPGFESQPVHKAVSIPKQLFLLSLMPYCYILFSEKLNNYVGACTNLDRRLYEHNIGHSKFTRTGIPWKILYKEEFDTLLLAKQRETEIKRMKSRKFIVALVNRT